MDSAGGWPYRMRALRTRAGFGLRMAIGLSAAALMLLCTTGFAAPDDDFRAGRKAYQSGDVTGALQALRKPADAGHAPSQALLGFVLESAGLYDEAVLYYRKAVDQGDPDGEFGLGNALLTGNGASKDLTQARSLFERAAGRGHPLAVQWLAEAALSKNPRAPGGAAVQPGAPAPAPAALTPAELEWVRKAAANDHLGSLDYLGRAYRAGVLGPPDLAMAKDFEARAEKLRYPNGRPRVRRGG